MKMLFRFAVLAAVVAATLGMTTLRDVPTAQAASIALIPNSSMHRGSAVLPADYFLYRKWYNGCNRDRYCTYRNWVCGYNGCSWKYSGCYWGNCYYGGGGGGYYGGRGGY